MVLYSFQFFLGDSSLQPDLNLWVSPCVYVGRFEGAGGWLLGLVKASWVPAKRRHLPVSLESTQVLWAPSNFPVNSLLCKLEANIDSRITLHSKNTYQFCLPKGVLIQSKITLTCGCRCWELRHMAGHYLQSSTVGRRQWGFWEDESYHRSQRFLPPFLWVLLPMNIPEKNE